MAKFLTLENNKIVGIRWAKEIVQGEIESEIGELGQILQTDGTFIDDPVDIALKNLENEYADLQKKKTAFELGALTESEYAPFKARLIEIATKLGII